MQQVQLQDIGQIKLEKDVDYQRRVIDERQENLDLIEGAFNDLNTIQMATKVELVKQTESVNKIADNSEKGLDNIVKGNEQVQIAEKK